MRRALPLLHATSSLHAPTVASGGSPTYCDALGAARQRQVHRADISDSEGSEGEGAARALLPAAEGVDAALQRLQGKGWEQTLVVESSEEEEEQDEQEEQEEEQEEQDGQEEQYEQEEWSKKGDGEEETKFEETPTSDDAGDGKQLRNAAGVAVREGEAAGGAAHTAHTPRSPEQRPSSAEANSSEAAPPPPALHRGSSEHAPEAIADAATPPDPHHRADGIMQQDALPAHASAAVSSQAKRAPLRRASHFYIERTLQENAGGALERQDSAVGESQV